MFTSLQIRILNWVSSDASGDSVYERTSRLGTLMGPDFFQEIASKTVIDFGCGSGADSVEMALAGAGRVIGIDIREDVLQAARQKAVDAGVQDRCIFATSTKESADVVVSVDAFEHFSDPAEILRIVASLLHTDGKLLVSFGPTWFHPLGGHLFSVFPWAHLLFSEKALIAWRSRFKTDGATRFREVAGGLNQMTIDTFESLVSDSPMKLERLELVPIRKLRSFHNRLTREFTTAVVRALLKKKA